MGTTAQKLQKLIEGKQAIVNAVNSKANTSLTINSKLSDIASAVNGISSSGVCESTGLPIEVDELPAMGTVVPNSGTVEKIYLNTSLSIEEVVSIIENANLTYNTDLLGMPIYGILYNDDVDGDKAYGILLMMQDGVYCIVDYFNLTYYFFSQAVPDAPFDWVGWNPDFNGEIELTGTTINSLQGLSIGAENDKLINLVSATPFGNDDLIEGAIYKLSKATYHAYFYHSGAGGLNDLFDPNNALGLFFVFIKEVETIDGLELEESTEAGGFKGYYVPSENVIYVYTDLMEPGNKTITNLAEMMGANLYIVKSTDEVVTPDIYLIYENLTEYYLCKNQRLIRLEEYNENATGNGEPIEVDTLPSTGVEGAVYKVSNYVDVIMSENGSKTSFSSAGIPIGSIHFVNSLPSNPTGSASAFGIYIVNSTNVVYGYDGSTMNDFSTALGGQLYVGNISSMNDTTGTGIYVLESTYYYVYSNGAFTQISSYGDVTITTNGKHDVSTYKNAIVNVPQPSGAKTITSNGTHDVTNYASAIVNVNPTLQSKTVTPTTASQNVVPDNGYYGLSKVVVNAIPSEYIVPTGTLEITENGEKDISSYKKVNVNVPIPDGYVKPTGTLEITENGTHDVTNYKDVNVHTKNILQEKLDGNNLFGARGLFAYWLIFSLDDYINSLDFSNNTSGEYMFYSCSYITTIPLFNTSNFTNMSYMFDSCISLTTIPELDTSKVTNMNYIFNNCRVLTTIPQLDTSKVTNISYMFNNCKALTSVPQLDTSSATNMSYMFKNCSVLETIDITHYNISSTSNSSYFVRDCTALKSLIIRSFGTSYTLNSNSLQNSGIANGTGYIYVPRSMVDTLKSATNWSTYADQIRALEDYTVDGTTTGALDETKI